MSRKSFRFAPSPNGRLHLGHAYSALLNAKLAHESGGRFLLRIEDIDRLRCTPELAALMLEDLAWLGLSWEEPVLRQSEHFPRDYEAQRFLMDQGLLYPCFCSRQDVARAAGEAASRDPEGQPIYPGTCRDLAAGERDRRLARGVACSWRIDMTKALARLAVPLCFSEESSGSAIAETAHPELWGDVVIIRKDIATSYHIAVSVDDAFQGITDVVRGRDLFAATAIHRLLQHLLALPEPRYFHHRLIDDGEGRKLSKSLGSRSLAELRQGGLSVSAARRALGFD
jgi:glutamyl-Q tRNA(Asp) synthetase